MEQRQITGILTKKEFVSYMLGGKQSHHTGTLSPRCFLEQRQLLSEVDGGNGALEGTASSVSKCPGGVQAAPA